MRCPIELTVMQVLREAADMYQRLARIAVSSAPCSRMKPSSRLLMLRPGRSHGRGCTAGVPSEHRVLPHGTVLQAGLYGLRQGVTGHGLSHCGKRLGVFRHISTCTGLRGLLYSTASETWLSSPPAFSVCQLCGKLHMSDRAIGTYVHAIQLLQAQTVSAVLSSSTCCLLVEYALISKKISSKIGNCSMLKTEIDKSCGNK